MVLPPTNSYANGYNRDCPAPETAAPQSSDILGAMVARWSHHGALRAWPLGALRSRYAVKNGAIVAIDVRMPRRRAHGVIFSIEGEKKQRRKSEDDAERRDDALRALANVANRVQASLGTKSEVEALIDETGR
jgi:hypothetical protein